MWFEPDVWRESSLEGIGACSGKKYAEPNSEAERDTAVNSGGVAARAQLDQENLNVEESSVVNSE